MLEKRLSWNFILTEFKNTKIELVIHFPIKVPLTVIAKKTGLQRSAFLSVCQIYTIRPLSILERYVVNALF